MNKRNIIILIVLFAIIAVVGGYFILNNSSDVSAEHDIIVLSKSSYMEVPKNKNATDKSDKKGINYYKNKEDNLNITSCSDISESSSTKQMESLKNNLSVGSKKLKEDDRVIYEKDGIFSAFIKNTQYNDTLLIQSSNKNLLLQCLMSVKYHDPTKTIDFNNGSGSGPTVINAAEKTQKVVQSNSQASTSSSSSSSNSYATSSNYYNWGSSGSSSKSSSKSHTISTESFNYDSL